MRTIIFLLLLLFASFTNAFNYPIQKINLKHGLSNNYVYSITQDKDGYIWVATEEGLNKIDGPSIIPYYKSENKSIIGLPSNELNVVFADKQKPVIWIGTQRDGLCSYNYMTGTFQVYKHKDNDVNSLITNDITDITDAGNGKIWIATYYHGIDLFDTNTKTFKHYNTRTCHGLPENQVWKILDDGKGHLYVAHVNKGLSIININNKQVTNYNYQGDTNGIPGYEVHSMCKDIYGYIWIGTNKGLALFNPYIKKFQNFKHINKIPRSISENAIYCIRQIKDQIWLSTELDGIYVLNLKGYAYSSIYTMTFQHIKSGLATYDLSNPTISDIYEDTYHNIWISTYGGGVNFIAHINPWFNELTYNKEGHSINNNNAYGICTDAKGRLWEGTDGAGINIFENGKYVTTINKEHGNLSDNSVICLYRDSKNDIWIGTYRGGLQWFDSRNNCVQKVFSPTPPDIRCIYEDNIHHIWIGCSDGLYCFDINNRKLLHHLNSKNSSLPDDLVRSISQDRYGKYWIGTYGGGLMIMNSSFKAIAYFNKDKNFCSNSINHILCDSRGRMWIATSEGLVCFNDKDFHYRIYQRKDGLANTYIHALAEDPKGNIWFSCNRYISSLSTDKDRCLNYSFLEGLPVGEFMNGVVTKDSNGQIYFLTTGYVSLIHLM